MDCNTQATALLERVERPRVFVVAEDQHLGRFLVRALEDAAIAAEWARTVTSVLPSGASASPAVIFVVSSVGKAVDARVLVDLARRLAANRPPSPQAAREGAGYLDVVLQSYAAARVLSTKQRRVLHLNLAGRNDKEIAGSCSCSESTVYEHWRRMARKVGGFHKADVIADFHRFVGINT